MLELLTRVLLWALIGYVIWSILLKLIPRKYLTWFGGLVLLVLMVVSFVDPNDDTISIIWRLISLPLSPLGLSVIFLGASLSAGMTKVNGRQVAIALTILLLTSTPLVSRYLVGQAERAVANAYETRRSICEGVCPADVPERAGLGRAGAIVVFGESADAANANALFRNQDNNAYNSALVSRLIYAADIYRQSGSRPFVIVTAGPDDGEELEAEKTAFIRQTLARNGVLGEDIRLIETGLNARRTADEVEEFLEDQRVLPARNGRSEQDDARVVLVAPAIAMSRAALTFEQMDMEVVARPTDFYTADLDRGDDLLERLPEILPNAESLALTSRYWNEVLTSSYYFLRGWLPSFDFGWNSNVEV
ncbi:MAG: ElyC/SanA/YdcF family protein [Cyanobacteria bacterium P01_A01_bin.114]